MGRNKPTMMTAEQAKAIMEGVKSQQQAPAAASASKPKPDPKQKQAQKKTKSKQKGPADKGDSVMSTPTSKAGAPIKPVAFDLPPEGSKPPAKPSTPAGLSHRRHFYDVEDYASSFSMMIAEKFNFDTTQSEALEREL